MANKRIKDLPAATETVVGDILPIDGTTTRGITVENFLGDNLDAIKGLTSAANKGIQFTGAGTAATYDLTTAGKALLDDADAAAQRTTMGVAIGTNVQAYDAGLQSISGLTTAADNLIYTTASDTYAVTTITTFGRSLVDDADAATAQTTLGLVPGTDVQAYNADLAAIAGLTSAANKVVYYTGAGSAALADLTSFGRSLIDDADASTARTTMGVAIGTNVQAYNARLADIAGITYAQGDIFYYDGTNLVKLAKGTDGQFLKIGTAIPEWATLAGGGDMLSTNNLSDVASAATAFANIAQLANAAAINTGTDATLAVTPDALAGSNFGTQVVQLLVFEDALNVATGDGAGDIFFRVPSTLNGMNLVAVAAQVQTAGTTGTTDIQIRNVTQSADMLTTKITIDSAETDSSTAATAAVIDAANDDVATGDQIRIDVDAVSTTPPKGLLVELQFRLP